MKTSWGFDHFPQQISWNTAQHRFDLNVHVTVKHHERTAYSAFSLQVNMCMHTLSNTVCVCRSLCFLLLGAVVVVYRTLSFITVITGCSIRGSAHAAEPGASGSLLLCHYRSMWAALKEAINRQLITQDTVIPLQRHRERERAHTRLTSLKQVERAWVWMWEREGDRDCAFVCMKV